MVPDAAVGFVRSRRDLARFFEKDQAETVRRVISEGLEQGQSLKQVMRSLDEALPGKMGRARLENIARTEATAAYNQGRVYRFLQSKGFIQAVRFDAILDSRVTDICQHRNGLLFALDDPRLRQNTPPLHYQCRSVLTPISGYKLEKMGGKARLDADRAKMDDAPGPQVTKKGRFGNEPWPDVQGGGGAAPMPRAKPVGPKGPARGGEEATPERTPRGPKGGDEGEARAPEPRAKEAGRVEPEPRVETEPGSGASGPKALDSIGEPSRRKVPLELPARSELTDRLDIPVGQGSIQVRRFWTERGEFQIVRNAVRRFPSAALDGLQGVSFVATKEQSRGMGGPRGIARGRYYPKRKWVHLNRVGGDVFDDQASPEEHLKALQTACAFG